MRQQKTKEITNFQNQNAGKKVATELDQRRLKIQCLWEAAGGSGAYLEESSLFALLWKDPGVEAPAASKSANAGQT